MLMIANTIIKYGLLNFIKMIAKDKDATLQRQFIRRQSDKTLEALIMIHILLTITQCIALVLEFSQKICKTFENIDIFIYYFHIS